MIVTMNPNEKQPGWLNAVIACGIKPSYQPGRFGSTHWLFKQGDDALEVKQAVSTVRHTTIDNPTPAQIAIADALVASGIATVQS